MRVVLKLATIMLILVVSGMGCDSRTEESQPVAREVCGFIHNRTAR